MYNTIKTNKMRIINVNISDLKEIPEFRNLYETQSIEELIESYKTDGQQNPIHITEDLEIVNGYRMVDAIKAAGGTTVLAIIVNGTPDVHTRIILNKYRVKTASDQLREIREVFKKYPKRQGQRNVDNEPYNRPKLISSALNGRWKNDVIQNKLEYIINHDLEGDILSRGIVEKNWKVDTCYDFLKSKMGIDIKKGYGFTKDLIEGKYSVAEAIKFITQRLALDNKHRHTFVIPKKANSFNMDCVKLAQLPEYIKKVDLTVTSIPYWDLRDYKEGAERQLGQEETKEEYGQNIANIFKEIFPVYSDSANVIINIGETYRDGVGQGIPFLVQEYIERETPLIYKDVLVWSKKNPRPQGESVQRPVNSIEYLFWFVVDPSKAKYNLLTFPVEGKTPKITGGVRDMASNGSQPKKRKSIIKNYGKIKSHLKEQEIENIIISSVGKNHDIFKISEVGHPAPMSPMLPVTPILMLSDEGDLIYDPFGGSNVVGKVALELNRRYVSTEISKEYFNIGCEMLSKGDENFDREGLDSINSMIYPDQEDSIQIAA
jgi:DNA modification methylase